MELRYKVEYDGGTEELDYRSKLIITVDGQEVAEYYDGGEPEDNYFFRDWNWVAEELEKAYKLGFEHGKEYYRNSPDMIKPYNFSSGA